ncbi:Meiosis protein mei2 [Ceratocystis lukuohia]|uniref:Meiosis protein mei2 n=1 Tax=Ceratocystis lukuohia TaxID=2019550 RepID=A0ABR4MFV5_9PEZI
MAKQASDAGDFTSYLGIGALPAIYHDKASYHEYRSSSSYPSENSNSCDSYNQDPSFFSEQDDMTTQALSKNASDANWELTRSVNHELQGSTPSLEQAHLSPQFSSSSVGDTPEYPVYPFLSDEMGFSRYLVVSSSTAKISVDDLRTELVLEMFVMSYIGEQGHVFAVKCIDGSSNDYFSAIVEFCDISSIWKLSNNMNSTQVQGVELTIAMENPPAALQLHPALRPFPPDISAQLKTADNLVTRRSQRYVSDEVVKSHLDKVTRAFKPRGVVKSRQAPRSFVTQHRGTRSLSNFVDLDRIRCGQDVRTTIMLRNIPNKVDQAWLKRFLDETSWGRYDFMYLRIDFANNCKNCFKSDKVAEVSYAALQGRDALVAKFRNSVVMLEAPHYRPKLFYTQEGPMGCLVGEEEAFPEPDNDIKMRRSCANAEQVGLFTSNSGSNLGFKRSVNVMEKLTS